MIGLTIDPGMSSGACLFSYGDEEPISVLERWQFQGGAAGLKRWMEVNGMELSKGRGMDSYMRFGSYRLDALIVEKFTPRPSATFALTQKAVEPLRGEGVLIGNGFDPFIEWAEPSQQYFMGGASLPEKKKRSREFLKLHDLYVTGKNVSQKDADDAISATLHSVAWLRRKRHMPTMVKLFKREGE